MENQLSSPYPHGQPLRLVRLAALILAALVSVAAFGQVTLSNSGESWGGFGNQVSPDYFTAQSFSTDAYAASYQLASVTLSMSNVQGSPSGFALRLYSDNSGAPGTLLETLSGNNNPTTAGSFSYTSGGTTLNSSSTYWLVASATTGNASSDYYDWRGTYSTNETTTGGPTWLIGNNYYYSSNSGSSWNIQTGVMQFSLSTVPEPSTYAAIFGVCALGFVSYRRYRLKKTA